MHTTPNKLIVITGCSGGGKSTLIDTLNDKGYTVIREAGREIVKQQINTKGGITPWQNPINFCELLIEKGLDSYQHALNIEAKDGLVFFDRCFLDAISYFQTLGRENYNHLITKYRFYPTIFITPPWKEIYRQDDERKHTFSDAVHEYERLVLFYPQNDYQVIELPMTAVEKRCDFILNKINQTN